MMRSVLVYITVYLIGSVILFSQIPAFPGAEGFGAYTTGGRFGDVYEVTNLNDSGSGSLREGVKRSNVTIVFKVSGYIDLKSTLKITGNNITIAGQTAPGNGICIRGYPTIIKGNNIIIRYLRFRLGDINSIKSDALDINDCKNIIIDHCSISWGADECASMYGNENVTVQWCMIGEGLDYMGHSCGGLWGGNSSYHHNLIYHNKTRNPKFAYTYENDITDYRNNVIYNWGEMSTYCSPTGKVNIINNYFKYGPSTQSEKPDQRNTIVYSEYNTKELYVNGNFVYGYPDVTQDNSLGVKGTPILVDDEFPVPPVTTHTAEEAYELVLQYAGSSKLRDAVDERVVNDVKNNTGHIIKRQSEVGGFPDLEGGEPLDDSDHDGMPDEWEKANGLDPDNPEDRNGDNDFDGYTNLEEYLNSLVNQPFEEIPPDTIEPGIPGNLSAKAYSSDRIDLTWDDNSYNERGFILQYSDDGWQSYSELVIPLCNLESFSITNLTCNTKYSFRIASYNTCGKSDFSNTSEDSTIGEGQYFLRCNIDGSGRVEFDPSGIMLDSLVSIYDSGQVVSIYAIPDSGFVFDRWSGDIESIDNPLSIKITRTINISAKFKIPPKDVPKKIDFGPGPVEEGFVRVDKTVQYTPGLGYGFENIIGLDQRDRGSPDNLRRDFVFSYSSMRFFLDVGNGSYKIRVIAGDYLSNAPNGPMDIYAEGIKVLDSLYSPGGSFQDTSFSIDVNDGQLELFFIHHKGEGHVWRINAIEVLELNEISEKDATILKGLRLYQNYPNPFNSYTLIKYEVPYKSYVRLTVYDLLGHEVLGLVDEEKPAGTYNVSLNASGLSSGIYIYVLSNGEEKIMRKFVLIK